MEKVELRPAFEWDCDECGRINFESCRVVEPESEQYREWAEDAEPEGEGWLLTNPSQVTCEHCGAEFDAVALD